MLYSTLLTCFQLLKCCMFVKPRLHDTTGCQNSRLSNRLDVCLHDTAGCQTGLTTVLKEQPLFVQPVVKPGLTTG